MSRFTDQSVIVTGGASGIGEACVRRFFAEGACVVIADRDGEGAARLAESLGDAGRVEAAETDVSDADACRALVNLATKRFGSLDVLVNSAGITGPGSVMDVEHAVWREIHRVNLDGTLFMSQAFARHVLEAGTPAAIVNLSSMAGIMGVPNRAAYVSTKHAIIGITKEMAMELGGRGVRVNAVAPGMVRTPLTEAYFQRPGFADQMRSLHALERAATGDEIAAPVLFLASREARFITGTVLAVDGGWSAGKALDV